MPSTPNSVLAKWHLFQRLPAGRWLFSRILGMVAPYSGSIKPVFAELEPGRAVVRVRERRRIRNHIRSIHAAALMNLCELTGAMAVVAALPEDGRMIVAGATVDFLKKARGTLTAEANAPVPESSERHEVESKVSIRDRAGDEVVAATVRVLVGPKK